MIEELTEFDKKLLDLLQRNLPLTERPFLEIGKILGVGENEVISRIKVLKEKGFIRRLGAFFDSARLGYSGTLIALKVDPSRMEEVALEVNKINGVTHNYQREGEYNLWFTLQSETSAMETELTEYIKNLPGVEKFLNLRARKRYKINVEFMLANKRK